MRVAACSFVVVAAGSVKLPPAVTFSSFVVVLLVAVAFVFVVFVPEQPGVPRTQPIDASMLQTPFCHNELQNDRLSQLAGPENYRRD